MGLLRRYWRVVILVVVCAAATAAILPGVLSGKSRPAAAEKSGSVRPLPARGLTSGSYFLMRSTALNHDYGRIALVARSGPGGPRMFSQLACDRVDFEGGTGLCLTRSTSFLSTTRALIFDAQFHVLRTVALTGYPSRARVSPDGRYGATTTFVSGDSYATMGQFSTRTYILDLHTGKIAFDLENLGVLRDNQPFHAVDFNFWGVTFANDGHTFYATLGTGGKTYLIRGDMRTRRAVVLRSGVECPSLSPDGTHIAFKSRNPGAAATWRISVLDLATLQSHPLAETRDVDDQPAWLNNDTVMYGLVVPNSDPDSSDGSLPALTTGGSIPTTTWAVPANGSGKPQLLIPGAWSTVVANP